MQSPYTKEMQLAYYRKKQKEKDSRRKGQIFEKEVAAEFQKGSTQKVRIGNQRVALAGGAGEADVQAMRDWMTECKDRQRVELPAWWKTLVSETPPGKRPMLIHKQGEEVLMTIRLSDARNFLQDYAEHLGLEVLMP